MAESVVVADNVELVANNIQNKVGATLIGLKSASQKTADELSEPSVGILDGIRTFQKMTVEKVQSVWDILKAQLDYDKDVDRKIRENEDKKRRAIRGGVPIGVEGALPDKGKKKEEEGGSLFSSIGALMPAGLLTLAGWKLFAGKLFRGGLWALLGAIGGNALVKHLELEGTSAQDAIMTTLPAAAGLMAMFNVKKALLLTLPIVAAMGMKSMTEWLAGDKLASEVSGFDWASVAITGPAAVALATAFGAKFTMAGGLALGSVLTIGMPVLIAGSIAIALAAGAGYLNSKVTKIEETMLEHLKETTELTQREFEENLKNHTSGTLAKYLPGIAALFGKDLTFGQEQLLATRAAKKKAAAKDEEFMKHEVDSIMEFAEQLTSVDETTLRSQLDEKHKAKELLGMVDNLYFVAQTGKLGKRESAELFKMVAAFSQRYQLLAGEMHKEKYGELKSSITRDDYLFDIHEGKGAGISLVGQDYTERFAGLEEKIKPMQDEKQKIIDSPEYQKLKAIVDSHNTTALSKTQQKEWRDFEIAIGGINSKIALEKRKFKEYEKGRGPEGRYMIMLEKMKEFLTEEEWEELKAASLVKLPIKKKVLKSEESGTGGDYKFQPINASTNAVTNNNLMKKSGDNSSGSIDGYRIEHALKSKIFITD
tara:strand:+ start:253 stop:2211 length:1959 start_codon:yes stop_codon:yes gene_type:complete